jgi:hypothetical protein
MFVDDNHIGISLFPHYRNDKECEKKSIKYNKTYNDLCFQLSNS